MDPITIALALGQFVPAITKWITGSDKAAEVAEQVVGIAETVTGKSGGDAVSLLKADPALVLQFKERVMERQADLDKLAYGDTASARHMQEIALQQDDLFSKRFVYYLATGWSVFTCVYILIVSVVSIPENSVRFVDTVLGFLLGTVVATIIQFFLGSSIGSKSKDALAELLAMRK